MRKKGCIIIVVFIAAIISFLIIRPYYAKYSKKEHIGTFQLSEHLFREAYLITAGGVLASDTYSAYLTDSVSFRKYIGTIYSDHEQLYTELLDSNHILVYRGSRRDRSDTIGNKKIYELSELKNAGKFE